MTALSLRRATEADIPFIMETERKPGYDRFIGSYGVDEHMAQLARAEFCRQQFEKACATARRPV